MNDEIKEYLDSANFKFKDVDENGIETELTLSEEIEKLLEDNKKLAELCDKYEEEHNTTFQEWQDIIEEHKIMKQLIIENGLWERLLNDDRFIKHLRSDDNESN